MKNKKAFTLIEIIVAVAILAILGTIGFMVMRNNDAQWKEQATQNKINVLQRQLEEYKVKHGTYPISINMNDE